MSERRKIFGIVALLFLMAATRLPAQEKYIRLGDDAYKQFQYQAAIENYQKALTQLSGNTQERDRITLRLAEIYSRTNNWKMAASYYKRLVTSGYAEKNPVCYADYAVAQQYLGEDSLALLYYDRYLKAFPSDSLTLKRKNDLVELKMINHVVKYEVMNAKFFNSSNDDFSLIFSNKKENEVLFTSNRKGSTGKDLDQWTSSSFSDLFKSVSSKADKFTAPVNADGQGFVNTEANEGSPFLNENYSTLYFTRCEKKPENKDGNMWCTIMKAQRSGARWSKPEPVLSDPERNIGHPALASDELTMIYSGSNEGGSGQKDLWMVKRTSTREPFGPPVNLGPAINTAGDEMFPYLRNDSLLYFASDGHGGHGGLDIWHSHRMPSGEWSVPQNMGSPVNSNADDFGIVFRKCCEEGYFSSNRAEGRGGDDIYHFSRININDKVISEVKDTLPAFPVKETPVVLPQILYELDKWDLQPQYQDSLRNFVIFLKENPNLQIELRSHTDSRATDKYNDELSQKRAQTVVDFLISQGVEPGRLVARGYGKREPRRMDADLRSGDFFIPNGTVLNDSYINSLAKPEWQEMAHQLNRRTEFTVISTNYKP